jgi:hypothetical protein
MEGIYTIGQANCGLWIVAHRFGDVEIGQSGIA